MVFVAAGQKLIYHLNRPLFVLLLLLFNHNRGAQYHRYGPALDVDVEDDAFETFSITKHHRRISGAKFGNIFKFNTSTRASLINGLHFTLFYLKAIYIFKEIAHGRSYWVKYFCFLTLFGVGSQYFLFLHQLNFLQRRPKGTETEKKQ